MLLIAPDGLVTPIEGTADLEAVKVWLDHKLPSTRYPGGVFAHLVPDFPRKSCSRMYDQLWRRVWAGLYVTSGNLFQSRAKSGSTLPRVPRARRPPPLHLHFHSAVAATPLVLNTRYLAALRYVFSSSGNSVLITFRSCSVPHCENMKLTGIPNA